MDVDLPSLFLWGFHDQTLRLKATDNQGVGATVMGAAVTVNCQE